MASLHDILRGDVIPLSGVLVSIGRNTFDPPAPTVPVNDIHYRSCILYDSGLPSQSGILTFNSAKNRLELIVANSGAQSIVTGLAFEAYDVTGGTSLGAAKTTNTFDIIRYNADSGVYAFAASVLQINMSGTYQFEWRVTTQQTTTPSPAFTSIGTWLEQQAPGGSFVEVSGTRSYVPLRNNAATGNQGGSNGFAIIPDIGVGHSFRIRSESTVAALTILQLANGSALRVLRLA